MPAARLATMTTPEISTPDRLYVRAGGMAFFEGLVDRFYDGVEADPDLRPIYPEPDLAGARHRLTLFLAQYWGGPTTYDQRARPSRGCGCATRRSRSARRSATAGSSTCAPRSQAMAPPPDVAADLERYFEMAAEAMRNRD